MINSGRFHRPSPTHSMSAAPLPTIKLYSVGGKVRDAFLGRSSNDQDYSVEAPSYHAMKEYLLDRKCVIYVEREKFGTIKAKTWDGITADFVLCRKDGFYTDGRRPDATEVGTIYDDLSRRDFCMNAIAQQEDGVYLDPHGGIDDIKHRRISCVGSIDRLKEDSLRLLRALRFHITLGFDLDPAIEKCLHDREYVNMLKNVSKERIYEELRKCFDSNTLKTIHVLFYYPLITTLIFKELGLILLPQMPK